MLIGLEVRSDMGRQLYHWVWVRGYGKDDDRLFGPYADYMRAIRKRDKLDSDAEIKTFNTRDSRRAKALLRDEKHEETGDMKKSFEWIRGGREPSPADEARSLNMKNVDIAVDSVDSFVNSTGIE